MEPTLPVRAAESPRWRQRPEGSNWGDFGAEDEIGRLNLITPSHVRAAVAEVIEGLTFCLSMPLDFPGGIDMNPRRPPPDLRPLDRNGQPFMNYPLHLENPRNSDVLSDDQVTLSTQYSTQWDGLAHIGSHFDADGDGIPEMVYYNGFRAGSDVETNGRGARRLGIETMAERCVQGRGVMIDLDAHFGRQRRAVSYRDLREAMAAADVRVEEGDFVCLHTGYAETLLQMNRTPEPATMHATGAALNGRDTDIQQWITDSGAVALICDNNAIELVPSVSSTADQYAALPLHEHCLFRLGMHFGEYWYLTELAGWLRLNKRFRFLLTAPPLRLPGAVGSPVTPIATV